MNDEIDLNAIPGNTRLPKKEPQPIKIPTPVLKGEVKTKSSFWTDVKNVLVLAVEENIYPVIADLTKELISSVIDRVVYGESQDNNRIPRINSVLRNSPNRGPVLLNARERQRNQHIPPYRSNKTMLGVNDYYCQYSEDAEAILTYLYDSLSRNGWVTTGDYLSLIGKNKTPINESWGWNDLSRAGILSAGPNGYLITLPDPIHRDVYLRGGR